MALTRLTEGALAIFGASSIDTLPRTVVWPAGRQHRAGEAERWLHVRSAFVDVAYMCLRKDLFPPDIMQLVSMWIRTYVEGQTSRRTAALGARESG